MAEREKDLFRETWVRYLGYSNEVGESFRPLAPLKLVRASYGLAFAYVFADTVDKSWKMFRSGGSLRNVLVETGDVLTWQTLASVAIPGLVINRICWRTQRAARLQPLRPAMRRALATAAGLACIPLIVLPIDAAVTLLMRLTYRRWLQP